MKVKNLKPYGEKWNKHQVEIILNDKHWNLDINKMYYAVNMIFNEYNEVVLDDIDLTFNLAKCWVKKRSI